MYATDTHLCSHLHLNGIRKNWTYKWIYSIKVVFCLLYRWDLNKILFTKMLHSLKKEGGLKTTAHPTPPPPPPQQIISHCAWNYQTIIHFPTLILQGFRRYPDFAKITNKSKIQLQSHYPLKATVWFWFWFSSLVFVALSFSHSVVLATRIVWWDEVSY